jgi:hypothetical protein
MKHSTSSYFFDSAGLPSSRGTGARNSALRWPVIFLHSKEWGSGARALNMVDVRPLNAHHVVRIRSAVLLQRSGIKEELLALGQHGGQPRS